MPPHCSTWFPHTPSHRGARQYRAVRCAWEDSVQRSKLRNVVKLTRRAVVGASCFSSATCRRYCRYTLSPVGCSTVALREEEKHRVTTCVSVCVREYVTDADVRVYQSDSVSICQRRREKRGEGGEGEADLSLDVGRSARIPPHLPPPHTLCHYQCQVIPPPPTSHSSPSLPLSLLLSSAVPWQRGGTAPS